MSKIWNVVKTEFIKIFSLKNVIIIFAFMLTFCFIFGKISTPKYKKSEVDYDLQLSIVQQEYDDIKKKLEENYTDDLYIASLELENKILCLNLLKDKNITDYDNWRYYLITQNVEKIKNNISRLEFYNKSDEEIQKLREEEEMFLNIFNNGYRYQYIATNLPNSLSNLEDLQRQLEETNDSIEKENILFNYNAEQKTYELETLMNDLAIKDETDWRYAEQLYLLNYIYAYQPMINENVFSRNKNLINEYGNYDNYKKYTRNHQKEIESKIAKSFYSLKNNIPTDVIASPSYSSIYYTSKNIMNNIFFGALIIMLISCILNGKIISDEHSKGTIRMLISKPIKRWKILTGKFLALNISSIILYLGLFLILFVYSGISLGFSGLFEPKLLYISGKVVECNYILWLLKGMLLCTIPLIFVNTLIFFVSIISLNTSFTVGLTIILTTISSRLLTFIDSFHFGSSIKFIPFTYINLEDYIFNTDLYQKNVEINILNINSSMILLFVSIIILLLISFIVYVKRDIKN